MCPTIAAHMAKMADPVLHTRGSSHAGASCAREQRQRSRAHLKHQTDKDDGAEGRDDVSVVGDKELHAKHGRPARLDALAAQSRGHGRYSKLIYSIYRPCTRPRTGVDGCSGCLGHCAVTAIYTLTTMFSRGWVK